ncbi:MAG: NADP-dependent malic enzyme [Acidobacteria bacterium]|nr:NADP-dependent malic enzyme [Acidobacteriota bacterium]
MMVIDREEVLYHYRKNRGLLGIRSKVPVKDEYALSLLYTPGVAAPCAKIHQDKSKSFDHTMRGNAVALVTDGSDYLDLGNVGPLAIVPCAEGQAMLCKELAGVDAYPLPLKVKNDEELQLVTRSLIPNVAVLCTMFMDWLRRERLERALGELEIPLTSLEKIGYAPVALAAIRSIQKLLNLDPSQLRIAIHGLNAISTAVACLIRQAGFGKISLSNGSVAPEDKEQVLSVLRKWDLPLVSLEENLRGAHILICCGPEPEISALARKQMAAVLTTRELSAGWASPGSVGAAAATQVLSQTLAPSLAFPGLLRGALDVRSAKVTDGMCLAAADAIAAIMSEEDLEDHRLLPRALDLRVPPAVAATVARAAETEGVARLRPLPEQVASDTKYLLYEGSLVDARTPGQFGKPETSPEAAGVKSLAEESVELHLRHRGAIEFVNKVPLKDQFCFDLITDPGVRVVVQEILRNSEKVFEYSCKNNLVAIVSDGSAILGLGNLGPEAAMPVMEGKALLFKTFAGVEAIPLCLGTQDQEEIVACVKALTPILGGVNLEDISAPRCFYIEDRLKKETDIAIFHDDQHGTATVVLAGLINALQLAGRAFEEVRIVINGSGASGMAVTKLLLQYGVKDIILCDTKGAIHRDRVEGMNWIKVEMAKVTNPRGLQGQLKDVMKGADVFIGLSGPSLVDEEMVRSMAPGPIVFAMANPTPEIMPDRAKAAGARIVATGRSDFKNQVNNALAFPGIFRGALDVRAREINDPMKIAAAQALAGLIRKQDLAPDYIIPKALDFRGAASVAAAVAKAAIETGAARVLVDPATIRENTKEYIYGGRLNPVVGEPIR